MKLSDYQVKVLENCFNKDTKHPDGATLTLIAAECGLTEEQTLVSSSLICQDSLHFLNWCRFLE